MKHALPLALVFMASTAPAMAIAQPATTKAACIWLATPPNVQRALAARLGKGALRLDDLVPEARAESLAQACNLPATAETAVLLADALRAGALMQYALEGLEAQAISTDQLDQLWDRLQPKTREVFSHALSDGFKPTTAEYGDLTAAAAKLPNFKTDAGKRLIYDFVAARAVLGRIG